MVKTGRRAVRYTWTTLRLVLERALTGDVESFGRVVSRYEASVLAAAYARLGNWHDAEDATQEAFITAYRNLKNLRNLDAFPAWLHRVAITACSRFLRRASPQFTSFEEENSEPSHGVSEQCAAQRTELREGILSALRSGDPPPATRRPALDVARMDLSPDIPAPA